MPRFELLKSVIYQMTRPVQRGVILPRRLPDPAPPSGSVGVITPIRQQILRRNAVNQRLGLGTVRHRSRRNQQIDPHPVSIYRQMQFRIQPPFSAANGLIAAHRTRAALMHFGRVGVNHGFQQLGPDALLAPAMATDASRIPVSIVRGQVASGSAGAKYPEHGVAEAAVVLCWPAHFAGAAGKHWGEDVPGAVGNIVAMIGGGGFPH